MSPIMAAIVAGIAVFLAFAVIGIVLSRGGQKVDERLEQYAGASSQETVGIGAGEDGSDAQGKKTSFIVDQVDKAVAERPFASGIALSLSPTLSSRTTSTVPCASPSVP